MFHKVCLCREPQRIDSIANPWYNFQIIIYDYFIMVRNLSLSGYFLFLVLIPMPMTA